MSLFYNCPGNYSAEIAPVGQADSQAPQSMQESVTTYFVLAFDSALLGQVLAQAPHFTHSSEITCIFFYLPTSIFGVTPVVCSIVARIQKLVNEYRKGEDIGISSFWHNTKYFSQNLFKNHSSSSLLHYRKKPARGAGFFLLQDIIGGRQYLSS